MTIYVIAQVATDNGISVKLTDIIMIAAVFLGPLFAVLITLWWQERKEKQAAKINLFLTLMAYRKSLVPAADWARTLNLIDVVFAQHKTIVPLWHEYYNYLQNPEKSQAQDHKYLQLLSEIGRALGYRIEQVDIDKFFEPGVHKNSIQLQTSIQLELLKVLQGTEHFLVKTRTPIAPPTELPSPPAAGLPKAE